MDRQNNEESGNSSPDSTSLDDFVDESEIVDNKPRQDGGFSGEDMTDVMVESNLTGNHLEKEILPVILASEFEVNPETMNDGMIPDRETGIQYDAYAPDENDPWIVAWATQVKQGHFNKNFQKNLGELLFLKSSFPDAQTVMLFGTYSTKDSDVSRAEDYLETYSLFWDTVINVTQEDPIEYNFVSPSEKARRIGQSALKKELNQIQAREGYSGDWDITLPAITGFADDYTSLAKLVLQRDDWLDDFDEDWFFGELERLEDEYELQDVFKRFDKGLTPSLVRDGLREAYYSLTDLSRGSKMRQLVENGDLDEFYYEMFEHGNPAKRWDYFNPTEGTVYAILDQTLDDVTIEWGSNGITSDGILKRMRDDDDSDPIDINAYIADIETAREVLSQAPWCLDAVNNLEKRQDEISTFEQLWHIVEDYARWVGDEKYIDDYEMTLRAEPWRNCDCDICEDLGIEVVVFRGNNRNRRRGFHNMHQFYKDFNRRLPRVLVGVPSQRGVEPEDTVMDYLSSEFNDLWTGVFDLPVVEIALVTPDGVYEWWEELPTQFDSDPCDLTSTIEAVSQRYEEIHIFDTEAILESETATQEGIYTHSDPEKIREAVLAKFGYDDTETPKRHTQKGLTEF
jgi:hypothetical protein